MAKQEEFYTFDEVLKVLGINKSKLNRLVAEGEIRAFRPGNQMIFRKEEVDCMVREGVPKSVYEG